MNYNPNLTKTSERQSASWDIKNAPKNYTSLVLAQGGTAFFSFASVWLITKTIGSEGYGGIVAVIAASQFVQIFVNWSITSLSRFGVEEFVETGKITKSFWTRSLIFFPNLVFVLLGSLFWLAPLAGLLKIPLSAMWLITLHIVATAVWLHIQFAFQGVLYLNALLMKVKSGGRVTSEYSSKDKNIRVSQLRELLAGASFEIATFYNFEFF